MNKKEMYDYLVGFPRRKGVTVKSVLCTELPEEYSIIRSEFGGKVTMQQLFDWLKPEAEKNCLSCGKETSFFLFHTGYSSFCGPACSHGHERTKSRRKAGVRLKYGADNVSQVASIRKKKIETCQKNFGVDFPKQSSEVVEVERRNELRRSGGLYTNVQHRPECFAKAMKSRFKRKTFEYLGRSYDLQGYEPQALKFLVESVGIDINFINVPSCNIRYEFNGKERRYYPDLIVGDVCVEVKSEYTAGLCTIGQTTDELRAKAYGVLSSGMEYMLMIMDKCGSLISWSSDGVVLNKSPLVGNNFEGRP